MFVVLENIPLSKRVARIGVRFIMFIDFIKHKMNSKMQNYRSIAFRLYLAVFYHILYLIQAELIVENNKLTIAYTLKYIALSYSNSLI